MQNAWWFSEHFCLLFLLILTICWINLPIFPGMEIGLQVYPEVFEAPICQISYRHQKWHIRGISPKEAKWMSRWTYTEKWRMTFPKVCGFCVTKVASISMVTSDVALNSHWNNNCSCPESVMWCLKLLDTRNDSCCMNGCLQVAHI